MNSQPFEPAGRRRRSFLPVLDRMIVGELTKTLLGVLAVLVVIIVSRKFLSILTRAIEGEVSGDIIFILLVLKILGATATLLPPALFLAILVVLGRMYRDNEMAILASSGAGMARLYRSVFLFAVPVTLLGAVMALKVMPWSEQQAQLLMTRDEQGADVRGIKAGRFNEFSQGDVILYAEELSERNAMRRIFVQSRQQDRTGVIWAEEGEIITNPQDEHYVRLRHGRRYQGVPGQADFLISEFEEYAVRIDDPNPQTAALKREGESSLALWQSNNPRELAELQRRLAVPLGILVLSLLVVPLSRVAPRAGAWGNVVTAFLIYVVYENFQKISQGLLATQKLPPWLAYGGVYFAMLLLTAFFIVRNVGLRWLLDSFRTRR